MRVYLIRDGARIIKVGKTKSAPVRSWRVISSSGGVEAEYTNMTHAQLSKLLGKRDEGYVDLPDKK